MKTAKPTLAIKKPVDSAAESVDIQVNSYAFPKVEVNKLRKKIGYNTNTVVMYSTTRCGYCKQARRFFRANDIPFKEYDVESTTKGRRDFARLNGRGVPIILVGSRRLNGFSPERFMALYKTL